MASRKDGVFRFRSSVFVLPFFHSSNLPRFRLCCIMTIDIIDPIAYPGWDQQVLRLSGCSFFHSSAWARVLSESYGFRPLYFTIFDSGLLSACLPVMEIDSFLTGRRGVSLPFTDYCEPLVSADGQFEELLREATAYGANKGWKSLELRGGGSFLGCNPSSSTYLLHTLDLSSGRAHSANPQLNLSSQPSNFLSFQSSGSAPPFSTFRESTRRNIRKASENGVRVEISTTEQSVRQFYKLNQMTRKDHGLPPQPYRFFEEIHEHVISKGCGFVVVAFQEKTPIAASVYFHFGRFAIYKYGASDKRYRHLRPNNLVMWEAIRWYIENGYASLSLGRTDLGHEGLRQFKNGWGVMEQTLSYYRYTFKTGAFVRNDNEKINGIGSRVASLAPLPVLRAVGSLLYRHMG